MISCVDQTKCYHNKKTMQIMTRFIFITGGVVSSLGKGLAGASLAAILQARGFSVRLKKLDPYLNVDPGTMSPTQHGEVFVTEDGAETDLDLGHYERFTGLNASRGDNITAGRIYADLIQKERRGDYLGVTVQVIPHVTELIKEFIMSNDVDTDFIICEIGGTVGDIEGLPFFEAIRQIGYELSPSHTIYIHLTLVPYIAAAQELKTKPTQHSVKELRSIGIQPNILLCRSEKIISLNHRRKIARFCNIKEEAVIPAPDIEDIYEMPIIYNKFGLDTYLLQHFDTPTKKAPDLSHWHKILDSIRNANKHITIALVGKYTQLTDAYKSVVEALNHGGIASRIKVHIKWIDALKIEGKEIEICMEGINGILVPGGFGESGMEGKTKAIKYAREHNIPFLGICMGMQLALIEIARNVLHLEDAGSTEFRDYKNPIVGRMCEWIKDNKKEIRGKDGNLGGTMRIGAYGCILSKNSKIARIYNCTSINERHRHRYEINVKYKKILESAGVFFSGMSAQGDLPEVFELIDHSWFIGTQFHPELKSRPFSPHPLFINFVRAVYEYKMQDELANSQTSNT